MCQFYQTRRDLVDVAIPYLKAGLEANECCIWATGGSIPVGRATRMLRAAVVGFGRRMRLGQVEIVDSRKWYLPRPVFDSALVLDAMRGRMAIALTFGFDGLRVLGDMSWAGKENWDRVVEYERAINSAISRFPIILLCSYPLVNALAFDHSEVPLAHMLAMLPGGQRWHAA